MIRTVVSTFGRQFADRAAADALGTWAVTLWQESQLSRERFLAAASEASVELLRDHSAAPSAAQFQNCLVGALGRLNGGRTIEPGDRREQPMPSVSLADGTAPRNQARD